MSMLNEVKNLGGVTVSTTPDAESSAIAFCEFQKKIADGGKHTINFTVRARSGESDVEVFHRMMDLIQSIENSGTGYVAIDRERGGGFNKNGNSSKVAIPERFEIKSVFKSAKPNSKAKSGEDQNWYYLNVVGEIEGKEIIVKCFIGNQGWKKPDNPISKSNQFTAFWNWKLDERLSVPVGMQAVTTKGQYGQEVIDILPHAGS